MTRHFVFFNFFEKTSTLSFEKSIIVPQVGLCRPGTENYFKF